jgi:hypothetical protein
MFILAILGNQLQLQIQRKWAIGLHNDIVLEDFAVRRTFKSSNGQVLERSYPIASAVWT